jgi:hypothetical protein
MFFFYCDVIILKINLKNKKYSFNIIPNRDTLKITLTVIWKTTVNQGVAINGRKG